MRRFLPLLFALAIAIVAVLELFSVDPGFGLRQIIWIALGLGAFFAFYRFLSLVTLRQAAEVVYWVFIGLLVLVLLVGGPGAKRWFSLGFMKFQASEFGKIALVVLLAKTLEPRPLKRGRVLAAMAYSFLMFALVFVEPDLATAGALAVLATGVLFVAGAALSFLALFYAPVIAAIASFSMWSFLGLLAGSFGLCRLFRKGWGYTLGLITIITGVGLATPLLWNKGLKEYQRKRIVAFVSPQQHKSAAAWQALQARIAIGSGGWWGKGYGQGTQKGLDFLPEAHTDFIFAALGEEFGFMGTLTVIGLFALLLWSLTRAAIFLEDRFLRNLAVGALVLLFYHTAFNLLSVLGLFPVAGIPLPFASYGGSHILMEFSLLGLVAASVREELRRRRY